MDLRMSGRCRLGGFLRFRRVCTWRLFWFWHAYQSNPRCISFFRLNFIQWFSGKLPWVNWARDWVSFSFAYKRKNQISVFGVFKQLQAAAKKAIKFSPMFWSSKKLYTTFQLIHRDTELRIK